MGNDHEVPFWADRYPPAEISPAEFEQFVADMFGSASRELEDFRVTPHEVIAAADGTYNFDATVRWRWLGLDFLVVVEAKRHANSIERQLVQVLHEKLTSVGAHKAVLISTAPFQSGALAFAKAHGIALVTMTEGRFTIETRAATPTPPMSREQAAALGLPTFVGVYFGPADTPAATRRVIVSADDPELVRELLLAVPNDNGAQRPSA